MFKVEFKIPSSPTKINIKDSILLMGSCFSTEIDNRLAENKFQSLSNPFGTIYNPISLFKLLSNKVENNRIVESQGVFYHWDSHSVVSSLSKEKTVDLFQEKRQETEAYIKQVNYLIITLGTAIVYEHKNSVVANCHKIPNSEFSKRFLDQKEIIDSFSNLHKYLSRINDKLEIILTVSPVRHQKDGLIDNNRSKSILLDSTHKIADGYKNVNYFPSYEIVIDELRDYRFYKSDMVHPSEEAINYVWEQFNTCYFDDETKELIIEWGKLKAGLKHKPFHPDSEAHQTFLRKTIAKLEILKKRMDVNLEIQDLKSQLT
ncbi:MAG: GSCFA domain-containing protein [Ekhidna sp.]|nr:GSCFA domain-containing protein [Ekhidna sp.]